MVLENDTTGNASTRVDTTLTTSTSTSTSSSSSTATTTTRQKRTTTHTVESQNADGGGDYQRTSTTSTSTLVERKAPYHGPRPQQQQQHEEADSEEEEVEWVTDIDELAELFERREPLGRRRVRGICGRVTKGRTEDDFRLLSDEPNKRLSWVVGPDGLERLCGKSPRDIMLAIGKDTPWLRRTLDEGYRFRLCLFPEVQARQATWDGVFELVRDTFPEAWPKVAPHIHLLPKYTLEEVQERFTEFDICASFLEGRDHHHYMTLERYLESSGTLGHTRAFLYHEIGLTHLFHGDGFTRTEDGQVGLREYLVPNRPLSSFSKYRTVELPLDLAELPPEEVIPDP